MASQPVKIEYYLDESAPAKFRWRMLRSRRVIADSGESYKRKSTMKRTLARLLDSFGDGNYVEIDNAERNGQ